ncbi:hypothetical protein GCM10023206_31540 [Acinetobacter puyangensis]|uniref:DUF5071 domain-containing protein n=1 Tax=Acinetobacter puyangensis TaxID=1096779 RepID=A0A240E5E2_9GAMM|nr:hypothetical protein [Acinetobacter puyangensis]SNX43080.1 hypothetical protein SAMN05421731_101114 [Acinetobacter puyangensis]
MKILLESDEINKLKKELVKSDLHILDIIDLAFIIKRLIRDGKLNFMDLIDPVPSMQWENIARILPYLPKSILIENLDYFLEWFMDLNWYGSRILYGYLAEMDIKLLKASFNRVLKKAIDLDDSDWVWFLMVFMKDELVDLEEFFTEEIELGLQYLDSKGIEFD